MSENNNDKLTEVSDHLIKVSSILKDHPEVAAQLSVDSRPKVKSLSEHPADFMVDKIHEVFRINGWNGKGKYCLTDREKLSNKITFKDLESKTSDWAKKFNESSAVTKDMFNRVDNSMLFQTVISHMAEMPQPPVMVLHNLFRKVSISGLWGSQRIEFPSFGAMKAEEIGPGAEAPEQAINMDTGRAFAKWGKKGLAVRVPDEFVAASQYDIVRIYMEMAGMALKTLKEELSANEIIANAQVVLDNSGSFGLAGTAESETWTTSGNGADGSLNGTLTLYDIFMMASSIIAEGFLPDTIMMHPMAWMIWAQNPEIRALAFANGGGKYFEMPQGSIGRYVQNEQGGGINLGLSGTDHNRLSTLYTDIPNMFPVPFRVVSSGYLGYNEDARAVDGVPTHPVPTADIYMADSKNIGLYIDDGAGIRTESWRLPSVDMTKTKMIEYYGFLIQNEGKAIKVAKNVKVSERGYDLEDRLRFTVAQAPAASATQLGPTYNA